MGNEIPNGGGVGASGQSGSTSGTGGTTELPQDGTYQMYILRHSFDFDKLAPVDKNYSPGEGNPVPSAKWQAHKGLSDSDVINRWGNLTPQQEAYRQSLPEGTRAWFDANLVKELRVASLMSQPVGKDLSAETDMIASVLVRHVDVGVHVPRDVPTEHAAETLIAYGQEAGVDFKAILEHLAPGYGGGVQGQNELAQKLLAALAIHDDQATALSKALAETSTNVALT